MTVTRMRNSPRSLMKPFWGLRSSARDMNALKPQSMPVALNVCSVSAQHHRSCFAIKIAQQYMMKS